MLPQAIAAFHLMNLSGLITHRVRRVLQMIWFFLPVAQNLPTRTTVQILLMLDYCR